jgi:PERQ amino acid-rich with GYF domain-containing protein
LATDVNSPVKPPPLNSNKDANGQGTNGRKTSISQGQGNPYGQASPASSRPGTRRQQTADSISSPLNSRFARDDSFFSRKHNESKDGPDERGEEPKVRILIATFSSTCLRRSLPQCSTPFLT